MTIALETSGVLERERERKKEKKVSSHTSGCCPDLWDILAQESAQWWLTDDAST
jgi:hypothetical protein